MSARPGQPQSEVEWRAAERTTINAHYTDPRIAAVMWQTLTDRGVTDGVVLEPGAGRRTFIGTERSEATCLA